MKDIKFKNTDNLLITGTGDIESVAKSYNFNTYITIDEYASIYPHLFPHFFVEHL